MRASSNDIVVVALDGIALPSLGRAALREGWRVLEVTTGLTAARQVVRGQPDLAVVQVARRIESCIEVIRLLSQGIGRVAVLAVAESASQAVEQAAREAGAGAYLQVPDAEVLIDSVNSMLQPREAAGAEGRPRRALRLASP